MTLQTTSHIIMVRPAAFGFNTETAANNTFQHQPTLAETEIKTEALREFDRMVAGLRAEGVEVTVIEDSAQPVKPDAIFPNNWISFHADGSIVTYPMYSPLRRQERRQEIIDEISGSFEVSSRLSFEQFEANQQFLEGTGSMVLDRENKVAYACLSPRTDAALLDQWCASMGYTAFTFPAQYQGTDIYHTNVMMAIGDGVSVVCLDVVPSPRREELESNLKTFGREVVEITEDQVGSFAGNMLAVRNYKGEQLMVMSQSAFNSLNRLQREAIERHARILAFDVHTIESIGGGSVRCMMAENFLHVSGKDL
jgi:hypothetical protein